MVGVVDDLGRTHVWNLDHRRRSPPPPACPHEPRAQDIAFARDQSVIIQEVGGGLHWWEIGRPPGPATCQHTEAPAGREGGDAVLAISVDGATLARGGPGRRTLRWDVATRGPIGSELQHDEPVEAIALTPDGRTVITGHRHGRLHVWDAETERGFDLPSQGTEVTALAVSQDGRVFASGTGGGVVRLWDTSLLGPVGQTLKLPGGVTARAFDPRGRVLAIGEDDGTILLRELPRPKGLGTPLLLKHPVQNVTFGEDGRRLLIGTTEGMQWWDLTDWKTSNSDRGQDDGRSGPVKATAVSPDGRTLATASRLGAGGRVRGRVEIHDAATGRADPGDPRSASPAVGRGLYPGLEVAPRLGPGAGDGPAVGRGLFAKLPPPRSVPEVLRPPGYLQP